jgi:hypothetical protein
MADKQGPDWQRWLWRADTPPRKKWLISVFLLLMLMSMVPLLGVRSFVPAPHVQRIGLYITVVLMLAGAAWLRWLYRNGDWKPEGPWEDYGPVKRVLMLPLMVAFLGFVLWVDVAVTLPWALNRIVGQPQLQPSMVQTYRSTGRYSCRYQLRMTEVRYILFEFCIDADDFEGLPSTPMPALLEQRRSMWGQQVLGVRLKVAQPWSVPEDEARSAFAAPS